MTELLPALMSIFIIVNVSTAALGVQHPCAILESELIMLFYKMIIMGLLGFFFSGEANIWASITSLRALVIDHSKSAITAALRPFAEDAERHLSQVSTVTSDPHSLEQYGTSNWQG